MSLFHEQAHQTEIDKDTEKTDKKQHNGVRYSTVWHTPYSMHVETGSQQTDTAIYVTVKLWNQ